MEKQKEIRQFIIKAAINEAIVIGVLFWLYFQKKISMTLFIIGVFVVGSVVGLLIVKKIKEFNQSKQSLPNTLRRKEQ